MSPLFYIHKASCISAQQSFGDINLQQLNNPVIKKMLAAEPGYEGIPPGILRRMGKAVRIGVGAALPLIKDRTDINGFIIGTANGGMEDCIKFLNQIIQYEEGQLTPGNFVQSTPNAIAAPKANAWLVGVKNGLQPVQYQASQILSLDAAALASWQSSHRP